MIPAPFTYKRAWSVDEALDLAAQDGEDAKFLAGGHSLLPLMKLRLAVPEVLIDIGRLRELSYVRDDDSQVRVGALTTHDELARSSLLASELPLLAHAASQVGDPQIRHRGTIGGSLVHADPAADLPAVVLALDATLVALGPSGSREIAAGEWSFQKFTKRAIDWAIVGAAVQGDQVALIHMGSTPLRAGAVEQALAGGAAPADAAAHAAEGTSPPEDINADREYREHLARVLVARGLAEARSRA